MSDLTWYEWAFGKEKVKRKDPTDASHDPSIRAHFTYMLDFTDPPKTFKISSVAQLLTPKELAALGYEDCYDAVPAIYELAFEMREFGDCEILRNGVVLGDDVGLADIDGPVRIRRVIM